METYTKVYQNSQVCPVCDNYLFGYESITFFGSWELHADCYPNHLKPKEIQDIPQGLPENKFLHHPDKLKKFDEPGMCSKCRVLEYLNPTQLCSSCFLCSSN